MDLRRNTFGGDVCSCLLEAMKRGIENCCRHFLLLRPCYGLVLLAASAIIALIVLQPEQVTLSTHSGFSLPTSMIPYHWKWETKEESASGEMLIEDIVHFGSEVLLLVRVPSSFGFPNKERLQCRYGTHTHFAYRQALAVHLEDTRTAVICGAPPQDVTWDVSSVLIKIDKDQEIRKGSANPEYKHPLPWNSSSVVYEVFPTHKDVVVFAHGVNNTLGVELPEQERLKQFQCVYGGRYITAVTAQANDVFRCDHPPASVMGDFAGKKVFLRIGGEIIPSLAYYNPLTLKPVGRRAVSDASDEEHLASFEATPGKPKLHHICACTLIYNGSKFLKEWVYYHSHLGVEKFYFYDNNSEDNLDEVIANLANFNVTKHSWPWVKSQEAGFSHCSLLAQPECSWMLYIDIDEYFFPNSSFLLRGNETFLRKNEGGDVSSMAGYKRSSPSILARFIQEAVASRKDVNVTVGQIAIYCHNYGPSGLQQSPPQGVTQGYTCRIKRQRRHKSIVLLSVIVESLRNQVHHFTMKSPYVLETIRPWVAIINHYKFQAWDEFKTKFHRRAASNVADWTEDRNLASNDRVPGLGTKPIKPADWELRYCDVQDYGLRDYTRRVFGFYGKDKRLHLAWE